MADIYERLALFLDKLPAGFPSTESHVELRILYKLFTPEEAELFMHLSLIEDEARVVAFRAHQPRDQVARMLDAMERKGLISGSHPANQPPLYSVNQFVVGFWEGQVNRLDLELVELFEEYFPSFVKKGPWTRLPQLRTIPVGVSIPLTTEVMHYERAEEIIRAHTEFAVGNCICRQELEILGKGCGKPMETCLVFGDAARDMVYAGSRRKITLEEALALIHHADEAGLVLQPANSQNPIFMCMCCGCCCGVLRAVKQQEKPAEVVANPFIAHYDTDACSVCGVCVDRCPMEAVQFADMGVAHNPDRCIGCGLCASTCPTGAITMVRKPTADQPDIPKNTVDAYLRLGQLRDRLATARMVGSLAKSQIDRLIAPK